MNRNAITAEVTSNMAKQKYKDFAKTFNPSELASELRKLEGEHCNISSMNYIESSTIDSIVFSTERQNAKYRNSLLFFSVY
jgi:hypothetical protein|nr:MAG TPA: hypothetical protein [Caudoviricetes sp.]